MTSGRPGGRKEPYLPAIAACACAAASRIDAGSTGDLLEITRRLAAEHQYELGPGADDALERIFAGAARGEGFGNARYARTIFEQALNRQALRLARLEGAALTELSREEVTTLEADDVLEAARLLGETTEVRPKRRRWLG